MSCEPGKKVHDDMAEKLSLKLFIDKTGKRLLFAEAGKDFIDLLFSFLALPLGSVVRLLTNKSRIDVSISSVYESVENLSETYIRSGLDKISLLGLVTPSLSSCRRWSQPSPLLLYSDTDSKTEATTKRWYYTCDNCISGGRYVSDVKGTACPSCRRAMERTAEYVAPASACGGDWMGEIWSEERGFVTGVVTYMVMDDLEVTPMSTISSIALLTKFNVRDAGALEEKVVNVGVEEVLSLLKASLQSKTALTDVFLK